MLQLRRRLREKPLDYTQDITISVYFKGENIQYVDELALKNDRSRGFVVNKMVEIIKKNPELLKEFFPQV